MGKPRANAFLRVQGFIATLSPLQALFLLLLGYGVGGGAFALCYWGVSALGPDVAFGNHLFFSFVTQATLGAAEEVPTGYGRPLVVLHTTTSLTYFACASALVFFKLLAPSGSAFVFDRNAVFYPEEGLFRVRVLHHMAATISNVEVRMYLRSWLEVEPQARYGTFDVPLKRAVIPRMLPYDAWNVASSPARHPDESLFDLEPKRRLNALSPNHLEDRVELTVTLLGYVDELKSSVSGSVSYSTDRIHCGSYRFVDPKGLTGRLAHRLYEWQNWNQFDLTDPQACRSCRFLASCRFPQSRKALAVEPM